MMQSTRRFIFGTTAFAAVLCASTLVLAQPKEVKVAVAVPLSGAWARSGELFVKGAELGVEHINAAGGIDVLDPQLGTLDEQLSAARPGARQRHRDSDFHLLRLRQDKR